LSGPLEILKGTFRSLDKSFRRSREDDGDTAYEKLSSDLSSLMLAINDAIGQQTDVTPGARKRIGDRLQSELRPYLMLSENADRWYSKPRGYAGDFMTIELMYRNKPSGTGRLGALIDRCFLELPPPRAARNRRTILSKEIMAAVERAKAKNRPARIASLACGPAREMFDVFEQLPDPNLMQCTLVDMDQQALNFVEQLRDERGLADNVRLVKENLIFMAARRSKMAVEDQDLIYSVGLIDYFTDQFVIRLIDYIYDLLEPGGRVILGNFHPRNPGRAMMDCVLDWPLIHRSEERMNLLFSRSKFNCECSRIFYEDQQINLFAECIR
jgi:SAM-dependent methyltransferase